MKNNNSIALLAAAVQSAGGVVRDVFNTAGCEVIAYARPNTAGYNTINVPNNPAKVKRVAGFITSNLAL